jgi:hypothetical protein
MHLKRESNRMILLLVLVLSSRSRMISCMHGCFIVEEVQKVLGRGGLLPRTSSQEKVRGLPEKKYSGCQLATATSIVGHSRKIEALGTTGSYVFYYQRTSDETREINSRSQVLMMSMISQEDMPWNKDFLLFKRHIISSRTRFCF